MPGEPAPRPLLRLAMKSSSDFDKHRRLEPHRVTPVAALRIRPATPSGTPESRGPGDSARSTHRANRVTSETAFERDQRHRAEHLSRAVLGAFDASSKSRDAGNRAQRPRAHHMKRSMPGDSGTTGASSASRDAGDRTRNATSDTERPHEACDVGGSTGTGTSSAPDATHGARCMMRRAPRATPRCTERKNRVGALHLAAYRGAHGPLQPHRRQHHRARCG